MIEPSALTIAADEACSIELDFYVETFNDMTGAGRDVTDHPTFAAALQHALTLNVDGTDAAVWRRFSGHADVPWAIAHRTGELVDAPWWAEEEDLDHELAS